MNKFSKGYSIFLVLFLFVINVINGQKINKYGVDNSIHTGNLNKNKAVSRQKGTIIIDGYYGFPNITFASWDSITSGLANYSKPRHSSIGPIGVRIEYMLSRRFGVGMEGSYAHTTINYFFDYFYGAGPQPYQVTIKKLRILPRFIFHIGKNQKLDPYVAVGVGYFSRALIFSPNNPANGYPSPFSGSLYDANWPFDKHTPVVITSKFGLRYFIFDKRIGIGAEVGLGGPLITFGLTAKFR
jgi:hypothetical protein